MSLTLVTIALVRAKNKDLLLTSNIADADIQAKIDDAIITVFNRVGEVYDTTLIDDTNCPADIQMCIKLIAASNAITDNYVDMPNAIKVAEMYKNEAFGNIKGIIDGKRRFALLTKETAPLSIGFESVEDEIDTQAQTFIDRANLYYR